MRRMRRVAREADAVREERERGGATVCWRGGVEFAGKTTQCDVGVEEGRVWEGTCASASCACWKRRRRCGAGGGVGVGELGGARCARRVGRGRWRAGAAWAYLARMAGTERGAELAVAVLGLMCGAAVGTRQRI